MIEETGPIASGLPLQVGSGGIGARLRGLFRLGAPDPAGVWETMEDALVAADVGPAFAAELVEATRVRLGTSSATLGQIRKVLADELLARFRSVSSGPFTVGPSPAVVLVVGVNGSGKTTTVAKLASRFVGEGKTVLLAAADTFRPAAVEQLRLWGQRLGLPVIAQRPGADPASVAFDAVAAAEARGIDVVIVDTAGRLHTSSQLMAELAKVRRVIGQRTADQPRHVLLTLDATTGQNGLTQAQVFARDVGVTGIVLTKLDGTAKGGVALAIVERLGLPVVFVGIGEEADRLAPFDASSYVDWLLAD